MQFIGSLIVLIVNPLYHGYIDFPAPNSPYMYHSAQILPLDNLYKCSLKTVYAVHRKQDAINLLVIRIDERDYNQKFSKLKQI